MSRYTITSNEVSDCEMPSVTEIISQLAKGDALIQWAVNVSMDQNDRQGWKARRDETADIGTELHGLIENYIKSRIKNEVDIEDLLLFKNDIIKQMFNQFLAWEKKNVKEWLISEQPIYNSVYMYAGTLDMIFIDKSDKIVLCDLKTKNTLYGDEDMQLSAYLYAWNSLIDEYSVKKYDGTYENYSNKNIFKANKIAILKIARDFYDLEYKDLSDNIENAWKCFLHLVQFFYLRKNRRLKNNYLATKKGDKNEN